MAFSGSFLTAVDAAGTCAYRVASRRPRKNAPSALASCIAAFIRAFSFSVEMAARFTFYSLSIRFLFRVARKARLTIGGPGSECIDAGLIDGSVASQEI